MSCKNTEELKVTQGYTAEKDLNQCTSNSKAHVLSVMPPNLLDRLSVSKQKKWGEVRRTVRGGDIKRQMPLSGHDKSEKRVDGKASV